MSEYSKEMRALDAHLAEKMGWTGIHESPTKNLRGKPPKEQRRQPLRFETVPKFHDLPTSPTGEQAKAMLLKWLAENRRRWDRFDDQLYIDLACQCDASYDSRRKFMLATPAQVATAAIKVLGL